MKKIMKVMKKKDINVIISREIKKSTEIIKSKNKFKKYILAKKRNKVITKKLIDQK
jgi:predicted nucleic acid-binding protein